MNLMFCCSWKFLLFYSYVLLFGVQIAATIPAYAQQAENNSIIAVVNSSTITSVDLVNRTRMLQLSSGNNQLNAEELHRLRMTALDQLIDEQLQIQKAREFNIVANENQVAAQFANIAQSNGLSVEDFEKTFINQGINPDTLKARFRAQFGWIEFIKREIVRSGGVDEEEVNERIALLEKLIDKPRKHVFEIFIPIQAADPVKLDQDIRQLVVDLRSGRASFSHVASTYSQVASAPDGGDIGWVVSEQMPVELGSVIDQLEENQISDPIKTLTGYYIFMVKEIKRPKKTTEETFYDFVLLDADISLTQLEPEEIENALTQLETKIDNCSSARRHARPIKWIESTRLKSVKKTALPVIASDIDNLKIGKNTGWKKQLQKRYMTVLCRIIKAKSGINREKITAAIIDEKGNIISRKKLSDMRSQSYIEKRI